MTGVKVSHYTVQALAAIAAAGGDYLSVRP
jgi:hypothetical protein